MVISTELKNNYDSVVKDIEDESTNKLPNDVWMKVFSYLSPNDLSNCSSVCSNWKIITNDNSLWKSILKGERRFSVIDDFAPLVVKDFMRWKEVTRYSFLSTFISKVINFATRCDKLVKSENPLLDNKQFPICDMPCPYVKYGNLNFNITNSSDVKIRMMGKEEVIILKGEEGKYLTHLAVEGEFLFTLRIDGLVIQWDHQKGEIIQEIQTAYAKGDSRLNGLSCGHNSFEVRDGFVIIRYGKDNIFEMIQYLRANESNLIEEKDLPHPGRILVKEKKLFISGRSKVLVWDLEKKRKCGLVNLNIDPSDFTFDIDVEKNILCASTCRNGEILLVDLESGTELKRYDFLNTHSFWTNMTIFGNLFIGFSDKNKTTVIDLNTSDVLCEIKDLFEFDSNDINANLFEKLVNICKSNIRQLESERGGWVISQKRCVIS